MQTGSKQGKSFQAGGLKVELHSSPQALGLAAAKHAAMILRKLAHRQSRFGVIFATGASQLETLHALTKIPDLPWHQVIGFHMDEYVGISADHPASFRAYMREQLTRHVALGKFHEINGTGPDPELTCREYAAQLRYQDPQLCLLGIGENGHLAFNDPAEADFADPLAMKLVELDPTCRQQQVFEGWFSSPEEVPGQALTLTIPTLLKVPELIISVPGRRKAQIVKRALEESISTACPATILRTHPHATMYLDEESASRLDTALFSSCVD